jgi:hypothetical protein
MQFIATLHCVSSFDLVASKCKIQRRLINNECDQNSAPRCLAVVSIIIISDAHGSNDLTVVCPICKLIGVIIHFGIYKCDLSYSRMDKCGFYASYVENINTSAKTNMDILLQYEECHVMTL